MKKRRVPLTIMLTQKSHVNLVLTNWDSEDLIAKILDALKEAKCCLEERSCTPGSGSRDRVMQLMPYIRAAGWHRSGDIWVVMDTKAGCDLLMDTIDKWLPKLSEQFMCHHKTYPVLIHGVPASGMGDSNITAQLIEENPDTIMHPRALKHAELLGYSHTQMPHKLHGSVLMYFVDPAIANKVIECHGRILPTIKFAQSPLQCYRSQKKWVFLSALATWRHAAAFAPMNMTHNGAQSQGRMAPPVRLPC